MKLIKKQQVSYYECICTGKVSTLEENIPLAGMLSHIKSEGVDSFGENEELKRFAKGLVSSFERDGFINDGYLTAIGEEIVHTKKCWKDLRGQFKLSVVKDGDQQYIVDFKPYYKDDRTGFSLQKNMSLRFYGEFENDDGMRINNLSIDPNVYIGNDKTVDMECVYDYDTNSNSYAVVIDNKKIRFPENTHMFKLMDNSDSLAILQQGLSKFNCFSQQRGRVKISNYGFDIGMSEVLEQIFEYGEFSIDIDDNIRIESIRANVDDSQTACELLLIYLERYAEKQYLSVDEIGTRISEFYYQFADCTDIGDNSVGIFERLLTRTSRSNKTAYLRLLAYQNLGPQSQQNVYQSKVREFSNRTMSIKELVIEMFGENSNIASITALTKYAYKNASISRAFCNFANALKKRYNIPLHLVTARDLSTEQTEVAKKYFDALTTNQNVVLIEKQKCELERIHDRYFCVKKNDGSIEWLKMSGELDAIRYENDFKDGKHSADGINESTVGRVKEMTVVRVSAEGIPSNVRALMEESDENN